MTFQIGARVACLCDYGSWTEYACVPVSHCFVIPEAMTFEEAAAIPMVYLTAYFMLFNVANLKKNKSILIHMAAGGVVSYPSKPQAHKLCNVSIGKFSQIIPILFI